MSDQNPEREQGLAPRLELVVSPEQLPVIPLDRAVTTLFGFAGVRDADQVERCLDFFYAADPNTECQPADEPALEALAALYAADFIETGDELPEVYRYDDDEATMLSFLLRPKLPEQKQGRSILQAINLVILSSDRYQQADARRLQHALESGLSKLLARRMRAAVPTPTQASLQTQTPPAAETPSDEPISLAERRRLNKHKRTAAQANVRSRNLPRPVRSRTAGTNVTEPIQATEVTAIHGLLANHTEQQVAIMMGLSLRVVQQIARTPK